MITGAEFSNCWQYRYRLWSTWSDTLPVLGFVMLNPSTADADADDATIRKCIGFARRGHYGGIEVVNLFAWRATKPADLWRAAEPVGPENDNAIISMVGTVICAGGNVVCAWGKQPKAHQRVLEVEALLSYYRAPVYTLRLNGDGSPAHPLMLPYTCDLIDYETRSTNLLPG